MASNASPLPTSLPACVEMDLMQHTAPYFHVPLYTGCYSYISKVDFKMEDLTHQPCGTVTLHIQLQPSCLLIFSSPQLRSLCHARASIICRFYYPPLKKPCLFSSSYTFTSVFSPSKWVIFSSVYICLHFLFLPPMTHQRPF